MYNMKILIAYVKNREMNEKSQPSAAKDLLDKVLLCSVIWNAFDSVWPSLC